MGPVPVPPKPGDRAPCGFRGTSSREYSGCGIISLLRFKVRSLEYSSKRVNSLQFVLILPNGWLKPAGCERVFLGVGHAPILQEPDFSLSNLKQTARAYLYKIMPVCLGYSHVSFRVLTSRTYGRIKIPLFYSKQPVIPSATLPYVVTNFK